MRSNTEISVFIEDKCSLSDFTFYESFVCASNCVFPGAHLTRAIHVPSRPAISSRRSGPGTEKPLPTSFLCIPSHRFVTKATL